MRARATILQLRGGSKTGRERRSRALVLTAPLERKIMATPQSKSKPLLD
jgi:hypothetical protein